MKKEQRETEEIDDSVKIASKDYCQKSNYYICIKHGFQSIFANNNQILNYQAYPLFLNYSQKSSMILPSSRLPLLLHQNSDSKK